MFYAAKDSGIHERLITKEAAITAFSKAIDQELRCELFEHHPSPDFDRQRAIEQQQQKLANISMARGMVNHVLHHDAWLYFRRNWEDSDGGAYVATWSLGWFLELKVASIKRGGTGDITVTDETKCEDKINISQANSVPKLTRSMMQVPNLLRLRPSSKSQQSAVGKLSSVMPG